MADMGQPPPRKSTVQLACGTVKYLHSFETNQLRKSLFFLQPEDVQVSTIAPGTVCGPSSEKGGLSQRLSPAALLKFSISSSLPVPLPPGLCHMRAPPPPAAQRRGPAARDGPSGAGRPRSLSPWLLSLSPPLPRRPGPPARRSPGPGRFPLPPRAASERAARCRAALPLVISPGPRRGAAPGRPPAASLPLAGRTAERDPPASAPPSRSAEQPAAAPGQHVRHQIRGLGGRAARGTQPGCCRCPTRAPRR